MKTTRLLLFTLLIFSSLHLISQNKWDLDIGLGASLNSGNVNNCNVNHTLGINRNDSLIAFDFHYKFLYSSIINKYETGNKWEETNFEINGGVKMDYKQYGKISPFLACEMLTNKYKGYDLKLSGLVGLKYRIYTNPGHCDYSISAAFVYDWTDFTDDTKLPNNNYRISFRPKIKQKLADNLDLIHYTFYQPSVLDFGDYLIHSVTKFQTKLHKKLFLDIVFTYEYRSRVPNENYKKHDVLTEISLRLKL